MKNGFFLSTELAFGVANPASLSYVVFRYSCVMSNQPHPNFDLERDSCVPKVFEGYIYAGAAQVFIHRFHTEYPIFLSISTLVCHSQYSGLHQPACLEVPYSDLEDEQEAVF